MVIQQKKKRKKPNYELKSKVIENGLYILEKRFQILTKKNIDLHDKIDYSYRIGDVEMFESYSIEYDINSRNISNIIYFMNLHNKSDIEEASRVNDSTYKKKKRLLEKMEYLLNSGTCLFCTFTFTDDVLESTSDDTRRQYVRKFLKSYSSIYIANIDYGSTTEREHYHAVILNDHIDYDAWPYGFSYIEKVRRTNSKERLSEYITKLGLHAIKDSCKSNRVIYSRN